MDDRLHAMTVNGWVVDRLCYDDVMNSPDVVRETLAAAVALAELLNKAVAALDRAA